ncbi:MAG: cupin domain-containing protein [Acidimicrobiia bacterium]
MRIDVDVRFPTETELSEHDSGEDVARIADLYQSLDDADLQPLWTQAARLIPLAPSPRAVPWMWSGKTLLRLAERAGESAPGHRHTPGAIRFVTEGAGTWTTVNGDACDMAEGDLVLTPPWTWHDHTNGSDHPMLWFDGLDMPLVITLDATFFEPYVDEALQPVRGRNISTRLYGGGGAVPLDAGREVRSDPYSPLLVYRRQDTDAALAALVEERPGPMVSMEFVSPLTGGSVMPTLGCEMHRLVPGRRSAPSRRTGSSIFVAYRGSGSTVMNGQRFDWQTGDLFAVPSWALVDHQAHEPSDLFSVSDRPVLRALGLHRQEQFTEAQPITSTFSSR